MWILLLVSNTADLFSKVADTFNCTYQKQQLLTLIKINLGPTFDLFS